MFPVIARYMRNEQLLILFFFAPFASFAAKNSFFLKSVAGCKTSLLRFFYNL